MAGPEKLILFTVLGYAQTSFRPNSLAYEFPKCIDAITTVL